jgi:hypothetical protein
MEEIFVFPPTEIWEWARAHNWDLPPDSATDLTGTEAADDHQLVVTSPDPGTVYRLSPAVPPEHQSIRVAARPVNGVSVSEMTLFVDNVPLAVLNAPPFQTYWQLAVGEHVFLARGVGTDDAPLTSPPVVITVLPQ